ncbi:MAG: hypothetical protein JAY67_17050 [Candidatus Thiodiazotropha taylori]|nr:hypothetical protein [Candidatus Thiodiazotropha taylori]MCG7971483.1 hypothetical protein [Candidatus Thiodiazotropha taylori]
MAKNEQISLKPQDVVVLFKLILLREKPFTYSMVGHDLFISASESHASISRLSIARLVFFEESRPYVNKSSFEEFIFHGAKYSFPATTGGPTLGIVTSYAAEPLASHISQSDSLPPVWPSPDGSVQGLAFYPLYPSVPKAAKADSLLCEVLSLFDAVRGGAAREREIARDLINERCL